MCRFFVIKNHSSCASTTGPEDRDCSVLVAISAHGRVKTEFNSQMTTISIEKYEWKRATSQIPTLKVSTNAVAVVMLRMPAK